VSGGGKTSTFCVFSVFSVAVMETCCDACGDGKFYFRSGYSASMKLYKLVASTAVDRMSMGHAVAERWWKDADFLFIYVI
jgi:hypothetical protein